VSRVTAEPQSWAGGAQPTVAAGLPNVAEPIPGAAGTVGDGGTVACGLTATPSGVKVPKMKFWSTPVPSRLARPIASSNALGSELRFTWVQYRCPESTATPKGNSPASTNRGSTPLPSMLARPTELEARLL